MHRFRPHKAVLLAALLGSLTGCGTEPENLTLTGSWSGVATLPDAFSVSMTLSQPGSSVTGTMTVEGWFADRAMAGTLNDATRTFSWIVLSGCEQWSGALIVSSDSSEMTGPVLVDRSGCPDSDISGTMTVSKQ